VREERSIGRAVCAALDVDTRGLEL
jgi:hypothetical protein